VGDAPVMEKCLINSDEQYLKLNFPITGYLFGYWLLFEAWSLIIGI